ncbi:bifunctional precorrin-2 dehydrogenase/sirohydrochlorin ferrochelatase [Chloroflexota bacterium]
MMMDYYPVFLKLNNQPCVVVGGGEVALRKVFTLREYGAHVTVISPEISPEMERMGSSGEIAVLKRAYHEGDLAGAFLTIAATDDKEINYAVSAEARRCRCLVNVVDDGENSDFIVPSIMKRGDITVAVSTGGRSPALARKLRLHLEEVLGDEYSKLLDIVAEVRVELLEKGMRVGGSAWHEALNIPELIGLLKTGNHSKAKAIILENLQKKAKE